MKPSYVIFLITLFLVVGCTPANLAMQDDHAPLAAAPAPSQTPLVAAATPVQTQLSLPPESPTATAVTSTQPVATATSIRVPVGRISAAEAKTLIADTAQQTILALKHKDMAKLAQRSHPRAGVAFSPYGVPADNVITFKADELHNKLQDPTSYTWGSYDGTGEPIELTFAEYYERFVYSQDFAQAPEVSYNELIGDAAARQQSLDVYGPDMIMVEYHFPGFEPKYEGMDWQSLRLVFQADNQAWYLVSIIHDQWTI